MTQTTTPPPPQFDAPVARIAAGRSGHDLLRATLLSWWLGPAVLALSGLGLRLWELGERSLWFDELSALGIAALDPRELMFALTVEPNMALYYWLLHAWLRVVSVAANEVWLRLPSVLFGVAALPLVYLLGRRLHSVAAGLFAAALLAANGFHVLMSQEARSYALLATLTLISFLLLDHALQDGRRHWWVIHGVVTALAFYCHFYTALVVVSQGLFVLSRRSWRALSGLIVSGGVMALLLGQLVPFFLRRTDGANLSHLKRPDLIDLLNFMTTLAGGERLALALYALLAVLGLTLGGVAGRRSGYRGGLLLAWLVVPTVLSFGVSVALKPIFNDRYLFAVVPVLPLLAGVGLARLPRPIGLVACTALIALSLRTLQGDFEVRRTEQWREAAAYTTAAARPDDGWIFISKWGQNGFEYYAGWRWGRNATAPYQHLLEPFDWQDAYRVPKYRGLTSQASLEPFAAQHSRIWLIQSHEFDSRLGGDTAEPVRDWLSRRGYAAQHRQFKGLRVTLYQRRMGADHRVVAASLESFLESSGRLP